MFFFDSLVNIENVQEAIFKLQSIRSITKNIARAIDDAKEFHKGQSRKSGIPYVVHPICVASIVAYYGGDEAMVCAALLHDVVEDTLCEIDYIYESYGRIVGDLVDALTKIVEIRKEELNLNDNGTVLANVLSFRKMLIASVKDPRVLVVKISDRMHNMLTLNALSTHKQIKISEETLGVYAPIAHRLGISSIKNELENISFYYIYPEEFNKIKKFMDSKKQNLDLRLHEFTHKISTLLFNEGFLNDDFKIESRVKRPYSIYLKMQRKGISIDEMLDLLAIRIILKDRISCYKALGIIHLNLKPIPSRIKDYIALPKENGYQTIHTTVFDEGDIFEVQIRTFDMHKSAEFGVAAHWKYKSGGVAPNMDWIENMQYSNNNEEEFYELARNELYKEDIIVFSPKGDVISLPVGAVALDFAYSIHSGIGNLAKEAYINHQKAPLLQKLKSGDIIKIITDENVKVRCTWIDAVKTSKAKSHMKSVCQHRIKEIDRKSALNILSTIFNKEYKLFDKFISENYDDKINKIVYDITLLNEIKDKTKEMLNIDKGIFSKIKFSSFNLKELKFDNIVIFTNRNINGVFFDYCCHPKFGDSILAIKKAQKAVIHHKLCDRANEEINNSSNQLFVKWSHDNKKIYKILVFLEDQKGILAGFLSAVAKYDCNVLSIKYDGYKNHFSTLCEILFESNSDIKKMRDVLSKKYKIKEFSNLKDVYGAS